MVADLFYATPSSKPRSAPVYWNELVAVSRNIFVNISSVTILDSSKILRVVIKKIKLKVSISFFLSIYRLRNNFNINLFINFAYHISFYLRI